MNQREIKFRAWGVTVKKMSWTTVNLYEWEGVDLLARTLRDRGEAILMQFTGLKDKNGKEIYEGDIVDEFRSSRSFPEGRHLKQPIKWNTDMTLDDSFGCTAVGFNMFGGELEVIGNIYENPELLNPQ